MADTRMVKTIIFFLILDGIIADELTVKAKTFTNHMILIYFNKKMFLLKDTQMLSVAASL